MHTSLRLLIVATIISLFFSSCGFFFPELLFKTPKDYEFDSTDSLVDKEYRLRPGDVFTMQVLSNNGYALVDVVGFNGSYLPIDYIIHTSGYATLPLVDSIYVAGLTSTQLEDTLSNKYSYYFINPFIRVNIKYTRVYVYKGKMTAQMVDLFNNNITLTEVLAAAGGVQINNAKRIKVIRGIGADAKVYLFDLSTVESYKKLDFVLRNHDIVYIEPTKGPREVYPSVAPILSIISSFIIVYTVFISRL